MKTLTADGMATEKVIALKSTFMSGDWPLVNMWWPHTRKLKIAMAIELKAMKRKPKMWRWLWTAMISLMMPMPGRIMMYTAGCE